LNLFTLLQALDPEIDPRSVKVHLASPAGEDQDPFKEYLRGDFNEWQQWQGSHIFRLPMVVSLIQLRGSDRWLFAGTFDRTAYKRCGNDERSWVEYSLTERAGTSELVGCLVVEHKRGRSSHRNAESIEAELLVRELLPEAMQIGEFTSYLDIELSKTDLEVIVRQRDPSWRAALSAVAGIYVISNIDTGMLYVGKADGKNGIWGRWAVYAKGDHGDNKHLVKLLKREPKGYERHFRYAVLETANLPKTKRDRKIILSRESHWMRVLQSRHPHGYNAGEKE
jgi:hypothetical protein